MQTYTVKQIADLLGTNQETVRRWIRTNKLSAIQESKKDGNVITEDELLSFLNKSPKYFEKAVEGMGVYGLIPGIALLAGSKVAANYLKKEKERKELEFGKFKATDYILVFQEKIDLLEEEVSEMENEIRILNSKISDRKNEINKYQEYLNLISSDSIEEE